jgi:hypothetical protein
MLGLQGSSILAVDPSIVLIESFFDVLLTVCLPLKHCKPSICFPGNWQIAETIFPSFLKVLKKIRQFCKHQANYDETVK